jgi:hypothetical protein
VRNSIAAGVRLIAPPFYVSEVDTAIRRRVYEGRWNTVDAHNAFYLDVKAALAFVRYLPDYP